MLLFPIFDFDILNFTKDKFMVMNLACVRKKHSRAKFSDKPLLSGKITLKKFSEVFRKLRDVKIN